MTSNDTSVLVVRRSIHIGVPPERVWEEFSSFERMNRWWGALIADPEAGTSNGQRLVVYEPRVGGRIEMEVGWGGEPVRYGGPIVVFESGREFSFENDWIPNRGWLRPTRMTLRLTAALGGTLVELLHGGFERVGGDVAAEHAGYETGWGMTQLNALRELLVER